MPKTILPIENQVPSWETCRELAEADFPGGTYHIWEVGDKARLKIRGLPHRIVSSDPGGFPAPTVAELWHILPETVEYDSDAWEEYAKLTLRKHRQPEAGYIYLPFSIFEEEWHRICGFPKDNPAQSLAALWLWLDEKNMLPDSAYRKVKY